MAGFNQKPMTAGEWKAQARRWHTQAIAEYKRAEMEQVARERCALFLRYSLPLAAVVAFGVGSFAFKIWGV